MRAIARIALGVSLILIAACGDKKAPSAPTPFRSTVAAIAVTPERNLGVGRETPLRAMATLGNGDTLDVTDLAQWQSSDTSIVEVSPRGMAKALVEGSTTITATYQGVSGSRSVTTQKCVSWNLKGPSTIWLGQSVTWSTDAYDGCVPHWTTLSVRWESDTLQIAPNPNLKSWSVQVTGTTPGTALLRAMADGGSVNPTEQTATITVLPHGRPSPENLEISRSDYGVALGKTLPLQAFARWSTPIKWDEEVTTKAEWRSSRPDIATVSGGQVTGRAPGTTIISVIFDGVRTDASLVVGGAQDSLTVLSWTLEPRVVNGRDYFLATVDFAYTVVSTTGFERLDLRDGETGSTLYANDGELAWQGAGMRQKTALFPAEGHFTSVCGTLSMRGSNRVTLTSVELGCKPARR